MYRKRRSRTGGLAYFGSVSRPYEGKSGGVHRREIGPLISGGLEDAPRGTLMPAWVEGGDVETLESSADFTVEGKADSHVLIASPAAATVALYTIASGSMPKFVQSTSNAAILRAAERSDGLILGGGVVQVLNDMAQDDTEGNFRQGHSEYLYDPTELSLDTLFENTMPRVTPKQQWKNMRKGLTACYSTGREGPYQLSPALESLEERFTHYPSRVVQWRHTTWPMAPYDYGTNVYTAGTAILWQSWALSHSTTDPFSTDAQQAANPDLYLVKPSWGDWSVDLTLAGKFIFSATGHHNVAIRVIFHRGDANVVIEVPLTYAYYSTTNYNQYGITLNKTIPSLKNFVRPYVPLADADCLDGYIVGMQLVSNQLTVSTLDWDNNSGLGAALDVTVRQVGAQDYARNCLVIELGSAETDQRFDVTVYRDFCLQLRPEDIQNSHPGPFAHPAQTAQMHRDAVSFLEGDYGTLSRGIPDLGDRELPYQGFSFKKAFGGGLSAIKKIVKSDVFQQHVKPIIMAQAKKAILAGASVKKQNPKPKGKKAKKPKPKSKGASSKETPPGTVAGLFSLQGQVDQARTFERRQLHQGASKPPLPDSLMVPPTEEKHTVWYAPLKGMPSALEVESGIYTFSLTEGDYRLRSPQYFQPKGGVYGLYSKFRVDVNGNATLKAPTKSAMGAVTHTRLGLAGSPDHGIVTGWAAQHELPSGAPTVPVKVAGRDFTVSQRVYDDGKWFWVDPARDLVQCAHYVKHAYTKQGEEQIPPAPGLGKHLVFSSDGPVEGTSFSAALYSLFFLPKQRNYAISGDWDAQLVPCQLGFLGQKIKAAQTFSKEDPLACRGVLLFVPPSQRQEVVTLLRSSKPTLPVRVATSWRDFSAFASP